MMIMIKELVITNAIGMNHCKSTVILFHEKKKWILRKIGVAENLLHFHTMPLIYKTTLAVGDCVYLFPRCFFWV